MTIGCIGYGIDAGVSCGIIMVVISAKGKGARKDVKMAAYKFKGVVSIRDSYGRLTKKLVELVGGNYETAEANLLAYVQALDNIIGGQIVALSIISRVSLPNGLKNEPVNANIDEGVTFYVETDGGKRATVTVPTPLKDYIDANGYVDLDDNDVEAFRVMYAPVSGSATALVSDGEQVVKFVKGVLDKK